MVLIGAIGIGILLVIVWIVIYNGLVRLRTQVEEAWSQIDVQLQRRNDLIPNLVVTVKGYAKHEAGTLEAVTKMRQQLNNLPADDRAGKMALSNRISGALGSIMAVAENYPDLKAATNFSQLQEELANTENKIAYSRQLYNTTAADLNARVQTFPANVIAKLQHFTKVEYLKTPEAAKVAPKVEF